MMAIIDEAGQTIGKIDQSDLEKILDVLKANEEFHRHRDLMNASVHLAGETRFSPLTSETISARERLEKLMESKE